MSWPRKRLDSPIGEMHGQKLLKIKLIMGKHEVVESVDCAFVPLIREDGGEEEKEKTWH